MNIVFLDTSILCNLLEIPTKSDDKQSINVELKRLCEDVNTGLIIPLATIIETGNHISHIADGNVRRKIAEDFSKMIIDMINEKTPWRYYGRELETEDIRSICEGFPDRAVAGMGYGDATIIHAYEKYKNEIPGIGNIRIWSIDKHLMGICEEVAPDFSRNRKQ